MRDQANPAMPFCNRYEYRLVVLDQESFAIPAPPLQCQIPGWIKFKAYVFLRNTKHLITGTKVENDDAVGLGAPGRWGQGEGKHRAIGRDDGVRESPVRLKEDGLNLSIERNELDTVLGPGDQPSSRQHQIIGEPRQEPTFACPQVKSSGAEPEHPLDPQLIRMHPHFGCELSLVALRHVHDVLNQKDSHRALDLAYPFDVEGLLLASDQREHYQDDHDHNDHTRDDTGGHQRP